MKGVTLVVTDKRGRTHRYPQVSKAEAHRKANVDFKGLRCRVEGGRGPWESGRVRMVRSYSDMMMQRGGY